jgi:hypothetical protein
MIRANPHLLRAAVDGGGQGLPYVDVSTAWWWSSLNLFRLNSSGIRLRLQVGQQPGQIASHVNHAQDHDRFSRRIIDQQIGVSSQRPDR